MKTTSVKLYSLPYNETKTYWVTILFMKGIGKGVRSCKEGRNGMDTTNEKTKPEKEESLKP